MRFQRSFRNTLKPIGFSVFCFALFSFVFFIGYIFIDYRAYVKRYQISQAQEIEDIQEQTTEFLEHFEKILGLIESRVYAAQGNTNRIQGILRSVHQLQGTQKLPEIQQVSYYKFSYPQMTITRFGTLPLDSKKLLAEITIPKNRSDPINIEDKGMVGRMPIIGSDGNIEGLLEVLIPLPEFWKSLGTFNTVKFREGFLRDGSKKPHLYSLFPIRLMSPHSFQTYALNHWHTYAGFGSYLIFSLLLVGLCIYYLAARFRIIYHARHTKLKENLLDLEQREKTLSEELRASQQDAYNHQLSCQLRRKLQAGIKKNQIDYADRITNSLMTMQESHKDAFSSMTHQQSCALLDQWMGQLFIISRGLWQPMNKEKVDLKKIIHNILILFTEKIQASHITIKINIPPKMTTTFNGDDLFIELLLTNAIGKLIHRVPKKGIVIISLSKEKGGFCIELQDNRFNLEESVIQNPFDFFIKDDIFQKSCTANRIFYETIKGQDGGMNVTNIILPIPEETDHTNVVQLFK
ncbi:MAG: HAMP domain-containing histidine kinase [Alphaproteobacteria bacterium]|nr:HAMP domain-containing histidine kinase [Alphaproteobacteria bacterium]